MSEELKNDLTFLLSFAPAEKGIDVIDGLGPMFYVTGNYLGDVALANRIENIRKKYGIEDCDDEADYNN